MSRNPYPVLPRQLRDALEGLAIAAGAARLAQATLPLAPPSGHAPPPASADRAVLIAVQLAYRAGATDKQIAGVTGLGRTWAHGATQYGPGASRYRVTAGV
jgi:hypothetical protein